MTLRIAPFLKFHIDEDLKKELALQELLHKVAQENAEIDRKRAEEAAANPPTEEPATEQPPLNLPPDDSHAQQPPTDH